MSESRNPAKSENFELPLDLFKWAVSTFVGFLIFLGSSYERSYFRAFGVSDFAASREITQIAINAVNLLLRPQVGLSVLALGLAALLLARILKRKYWNVLLASTVAISFALAGILGQRLASADALALLTGKVGRVVWCMPKPDAFDEQRRAAFERETEADNFRLLFEQGGYLFLTNARNTSKTASKEKPNDIQGMALIVKREDFVMCRVSGMRFN